MPITKRHEAIKVLTATLPRVESLNPDYGYCFALPVEGAQIWLLTKDNNDTIVAEIAINEEVYSKRENSRPFWWRLGDQIDRMCPDWYQSGGPFTSYFRSEYGSTKDTCFGEWVNKILEALPKEETNA